MTPKLGDEPLLADTSAWSRAGAPSVTAAWASALSARTLLTSPPVSLELLYSATDRHELRRHEDALADIRSLPLTQSVARTALGAMRDLADVQPGYHRLPAADYLIAAAAHEAGVGVLHYDRHFDRLAEVLDFDSVWMAPAGSL